MRRLAFAAALLLLTPAPFAHAQPAPAPANARFYADCFADSTANKSYDRNGAYLRFTCYGAAAQAFYEALGPWSGPKGWERTVDGMTYRFTAAVKKDDSGSGVDRCWHAPAGNPVYGCLLVFPAGKFIDG
jgi:hypothetical protein